jgi:hypothetical protein
MRCSRATLTLCLGPGPSAKSGFGPPFNIRLTLRGSRQRARPSRSGLALEASSRVPPIGPARRTVCASRPAFPPICRGGGRPAVERGRLGARTKAGETRPSANNSTEIELLAICAQPPQHRGQEKKSSRLCSGYQKRWLQPGDRRPAVPEHSVIPPAIEPRSLPGRNATYFRFRPPASLHSPAGRGYPRGYRCPSGGAAHRATQKSRPKAALP